LKVKPGYAPCPVAEGDELFPNGIFEFNITKIIAYIKVSNVACEEIALSELPKGYSTINESHINSVDTTVPVILAEIAPNRYNLIDEHHRAEKARSEGATTITAYKLSVDQHISFLTSQKAYLAYIDYWNGKCRSLRTDGVSPKGKQVNR